MNRNPIQARLAASARAAEVRAERFEVFEIALAAGLTVEQALDDARWPSMKTAVRTYQRVGRAIPKELYRAHLESKRVGV